MVGTDQSDQHGDEFEKHEEGSPEGQTASELASNQTAEEMNALTSTSTEATEAVSEISPKDAAREQWRTELGDRIALTDKSLGLLPKKCILPKYNRSQLETGILHIGESNFFRSFWGRTVHEYLNTQSEGWEGWGISAVSLRNPHYNLSFQDGLYCCVEADGKSASEDTVRVIGAVKEYIYAPEEKQQIIKSFANPELKMVTVTVTQNGYYVDPNKSWGLKTEDPEVINDIALLKSGNLETDIPHTTIGMIVAALKLRKEAGLDPVTVISLDNLPNNGKVLGAAVSEMATQVDRTLGAWVEKSIQFPTTMVDRITPKPEASFMIEGADSHFVDTHPVFAEPFIQLIIEDKWSGDRPKLETVPWVTVTTNIEPYVMAKASMLNAMHTLSAALGSRIGETEYLHDLMGERRYKDFIDAVMQHEIQPTLLPIGSIDPNEYRNSIIERLESDRLPDEIARLGSQLERKVPKYILPIIRRARQQGHDNYDGLALSVACWMKSVFKEDEKGRPIELDVQEHMVPILSEFASPERLIECNEVLGSDLPDSITFQRKIEIALELLSKKPLAEIIDFYLANEGKLTKNDD